MRLVRVAILYSLRDLPYAARACGDIVLLAGLAVCGAIALHTVSLLWEPAPLHSMLYHCCGSRRHCTPCCITAVGAGAPLETAFFVKTSGSIPLETAFFCENEWVYPPRNSLFCKNEWGKFPLYSCMIVPKVK